MGIVKSLQIEAEERGWSADDDRFVCANCVEDVYLKSVIQSHLCNTACSYCHHNAEVDIAAPLDSLMETIVETLKFCFIEPRGSAFLGMKALTWSSRDPPRMHFTKCLWSAA